jgi:predicted transcriptional regulator of viral defense system
MRRGVYRLSEFPPGDREHLVVLWLWSGQRGVFSHGTALALHDLSDLLPERVHMTLPESERSRRRTSPAGLVLHYGEIRDQDRAWHDYIPITTPKRTLLDCIADSLSPELLEQALEDAVARGLLDVTGVTTISQGIERLKVS